MLKVLIVAIIALIAVLAFAATRPDVFRVQRSIEINAPAAKIFGLIDDFHQWSRWAPQDKDDPTIVRTYSGAGSGKGAISEWHGSGSTGRGRMEITESKPDTTISVKTDFVKPFEAHNVNVFTLESSGTATKVTWTMQGSNLYMMKVMGLFMNMDRQAGKHFEAGLQNLKTAAEE